VHDATLSQDPAVVKMLADGIAGHAVVIHPSADAHVFPRDGVGHGSHTDLVAFGCVGPVHAVFMHDPIVVKIFVGSIESHGVLPQPFGELHEFPIGGDGQASHKDFSAFGIVCPIHAIFSQEPAVVKTFVEAIAEHITIAQPSTDVHVFPREGVGHASHPVFVAFGTVWPAHAVLTHEPAVVNIFADGIDGHAVMAHPSADAHP